MESEPPRRRRPRRLRRQPRPRVSAAAIGRLADELNTQARPAKQQLRKPPTFRRPTRAGADPDVDRRAAANGPVTERAADLIGISFHRRRRSRWDSVSPDAWTLPRAGEN